MEIAGCLKMNISLAFIARAAAAHEVHARAHTRRHLQNTSQNIIFPKVFIFHFLHLRLSRAHTFSSTHTQLYSK